MGSTIHPIFKATHPKTIFLPVPTPLLETRGFVSYLLCFVLMSHLYVQAQSSSEIATNLPAPNSRVLAHKEAVEVYHKSGKSGEIIISGRAHKRGLAENLQVELAFQSELGPVAITLPVKRISSDTARLASFGFETVVCGLPQIAPSDPRHAQPFFAIHIADAAMRGSRYYREESYAQFISAGEKPIAVQRVIELSPQSLFASVRKPARRAPRVPSNAQTSAFTLKATRQNSAVCTLEWTNSPAASSTSQTPSIIYRNEQHLAITFAKRYVDQANVLKPNTKYRVEQISKEGVIYASNTVELPAENAREGLSMSALDTGGLYAASSYVERTPEALAAVVSKHNAAIQYCYQRELKLNSELKGEIRVRIVISTRGSVDSVSVLSSTLKNPSVEDCVVGRIKRWNDFGPSEPSKGGIAIKQTYVFGY